MTKIAMMGSIHSDGWSVLEKNGCDVFEITDFSSDSLKGKLQDADGIALRTARLTKDILEKCHKLKIVSRHGVGYDNVDINYLNDNKIALAITGTANAVTVAEHVMAMFLNLSKLLKISISFFPKNDKESHPIKVMRNIAIIISIPGISIGR